MHDLFSSAPSAATSNANGVHVGIGGWTYAPWRGGMFYPAGLVQRRELEFASRQLTSIEINSTYYGTQKPTIYAGWRDATPEDFVFSVKAPKRITSAGRLASTGVQIEDFIGGIGELGNRLGPLVWQFEAGRQIDPDDFAAFLELLPAVANGHHLRHALEVRDPLFANSALVTLARQRGVALVHTDSPDHPSFADLSADFVYARLMRSRAELSSGYPAQELQRWAEHVRDWQRGDDPKELPHLSAAPASQQPREVFIYFISAAKERNPAAAKELLRLLGES